MKLSKILPWIPIIGMVYVLINVFFSYQFYPKKIGFSNSWITGLNAVYQACCVKLLELFLRG